MNDKQLQQDILDVFQWDPRVETAGISINVENGIVTLTGAVGTDEERIATEEESAMSRAFVSFANGSKFGKHLGRGHGTADGFRFADRLSGKRLETGDGQLLVLMRR